MRLWRFPRLHPALHIAYTDKSAAILGAPSMRDPPDLRTAVTETEGGVDARH